MPSWVPGVLVTVAVSAASAYGFLRLRCRRLGRPFGPKAKSSAIAVIVITVIISTGLGVAAVAVGHHLRAAYVGLVLPSGLWLGEVAAQRKRQRGSLWPRQLTAGLTFPLRRLDDGMGDDMSDWCDTRLRAALKPPPHLPDAVQYYYNQVAGRVKDEQALEELDRWRKSIAHKTRIVRLIELGTSTSRLWSELESHPATSGMSKYAADDPHRLGRRLASDAESEYGLFLASLYRLGFYKLLIYGFRSPRPS
jgi:hypothetical protein